MPVVTIRRTMLHFFLARLPWNAQGVPGTKTPEIAKRFLGATSEDVETGVAAVPQSALPSLLSNHNTY